MRAIEIDDVVLFIGDNQLHTVTDIRNDDEDGEPLFYTLDGNLKVYWADVELVMEVPAKKAPASVTLSQVELRQA